MGRPLKEVGNEGNPNKVGVFNQDVKMGTALLQGSQSIKGTVTSDVLSLDVKAIAVISAYSTAGTLTGPLTPIAGGTPSTGQVIVDRLGNIVFAAADAVTAVEVVYVPAEGDTVSSAIVTDAAGLATFPNSSTARIITSATIDGNARTVIARDGTPSAGEVALTLDGSGAQFNVADANSSAVVTYIEFPAETVVERLLGDVDY